MPGLRLRAEAGALPLGERRNYRYGPSICPGSSSTPPSKNRRNAWHGPAFLGEFALDSFHYAAGAVWHGGVWCSFPPFPAWALTRGFWAGCWEPLLRPGRISVTPACTFEWIKCGERGVLWVTQLLAVERFPLVRKRVHLPL